MLIFHSFGNGGNAETPPAVVVQQCTEDAGRIEVGMAVPVDGAVDANQCDRAHVADHAVVFYWLVGHRRLGGRRVTRPIIPLTRHLSNAAPGS